jgi:chromosome segregation ATPase
MDTEDRMARLESDIGELKSDVKSLNARLTEFIIATAKEFGGLRTEMEKNRADTEKRFGSLETAIESAKLWMLVTGVGSVILVTFVTFLGRALKPF